MRRARAHAARGERKNEGGNELLPSRVACVTDSCVGRRILGGLLLSFAPSPVSAATTHASHAARRVDRPRRRGRRTGRRPRPRSEGDRPGDEQMPNSSDPHSAAALRINAAGLTPPLPLLLLHGWSPGPGLPGSLLTSGLFTVHEIEASTILTIATNRYALALVGVLCATFVLIANAAGDVWYVWFALLPALFGSWQLKKMAVGFTLDTNVAEASRAIARIRPVAVVGYSWGGAIAECCIHSGIWSGPTLLLAPCGALLSGHAGRSAPTLSRLRSGVDGAEAASTGSLEAKMLGQQPVVTLVHGDADAIVPVQDSYALARSAADGVCELVVGRDDHFLWRLCSANTLLDMLVSMIAGSDSNKIRRT